MNSKQKVLDVFLQVVLTACFFYSLTGGAFLIDWTSVPHWKNISKISAFLSTAIVVGVGVFLYLRNREKLLALQPYRGMAYFFNCRPVISLGLLYVSFFVTQIGQQLTMHYGLETHLWDLGFYEQVLWNTAHGDFLITSVRGGLHIFAEHFKPILALIAQIYRIKSESWFLLVATDFLTSSSLVAVYLIARNIGSGSKVPKNGERVAALSHEDALTLTLCVFSFSPLVSGINFLYHTQMLIDPFLLWGFYFILKNRYFSAVFFLILTLACKESAVIDLLGLSLFLFALRKRIPATIVSVLWITTLLFFIFWVRPHYAFSGHFKNIWAFYSDWLNPNAHPLAIFLSPPNPIFYGLKIFGPFLFLSFACSGGWLLLGPSLLFRILCLDTGLRSTTCHYVGGFEALIFISAIYGFAAWTRPISPLNAKRFFSPLLAKLKEPAFFRILLLVTAILFAGRSQLMFIDRFLGKASQPDNQRVIRVLESIPSDFSVLASTNLAAHVSHRTHMFVFCEMFKNTPYEKLAEHPDLIVYDHRNTGPCGDAKVQECIGRGYVPLFETDFLKIFADPDMRLSQSENLKKEWNVIVRRPIVPYQGMVRSWFRGFILIIFSVFVAVVLRNSYRGESS